MTAAPDTVRDMISGDVGLTFTAHNVALPDGTCTLPGRELTAGSAITRAALQDLELAFPAEPRESVHVADLGCLEGGHAVAFAQAGYTVTGYEVRTENLMCCNYVAEHMQLPNLEFVQADVRDILVDAGWDAVFCSGLLYHLHSPVAFLRQLAEATGRLLILQTHYTAQPDAVHEGRRGRWHEEGQGRWASWKNPRSFWLTRDALLAVLGEVFDVVYEQPAGVGKSDLAHPDRSMFVGVKLIR